MSEKALADLTHTQSVRGVLPQPGYQDKPDPGFANKAGGGRNKRKTMRGSEARPLPAPRKMLSWMRMLNLLVLKKKKFPCKWKIPPKNVWQI